MPLPFYGTYYTPQTYQAGFVAVSIGENGRQTARGFVKQVVYVPINWLNIYTSNAVIIDLDKAQTPALKEILGVYVDNTGNPSGVTLVCPDTNYSVYVAEYSYGYFPIFTGRRRIVVYNYFQLGGTAQTFLNLCNFESIPFEEQGILNNNPQITPNSLLTSAIFEVGIPINTTGTHTVTVGVGGAGGVILTGFELLAAVTGSTANVIVQVTLNAGPSYSPAWTFCTPASSTQGMYFTLGNRSGLFFPSATSSLNVQATVTGTGISAGSEITGNLYYYIVS